MDLSRLTTTNRIDMRGGNFPKGSCLAGFSQNELDDVARHLNSRPRKTLGFQSPSYRLAQVLH